MIFTIAIPTYNNSTVIEKCIKSCLSQEFEQEYEILVVDNVSTDNTQEILAKYTKNIRIVRNSDNVGLWENHNVCLREASGDYVVFCHSDDILLPDCLSKLYEILVKNKFPNKIVVWGKTLFRDFQSNWEKTGFKLNECRSGDQIINAFLDGGLTPSGTCYSRLTFLNNGGFIVPEITLAPSDMVSIWRLIFDGFFFEMSSNQFFIREFASTARNISKDKWIEAKIIVVKNFIENTSEDKFKLLRKTMNSVISFNLATVIALRKNRIVNRRYVLRCFCMLLWKEPFQFLHKAVYSYLIALFKY